MRRVVVTPTFAGGLGIVMAALLAYPLAARSVFHYQTPSGQPCHVKGCGVGPPGNIPALASAKPGFRLVAPARAVPLPQPSVPATPGSAPSTTSPPPPGGSPPPRGGKAVVEYQTLRQGQQAFFASLTVVHGGGGRSQAWQLKITYSSAHIIDVWGGQVLAQGPRSVLVGPSGGSWGGNGGGGWHGISIMIEVSGHAKPPTRCAFDGQACAVVVSNQSGYRG